MLLAALPTLVLVVLAGSFVYAVAHLNINGRRDVPDEFIEKFRPHEELLRAEGDRLLREAGVDPRGSTSCQFDPSHRPPSYETATAAPDLKDALTELGIGKRYVSYCAVVFSIPGSVGFGADNPHALLYKGTELYTPDASCGGLMGSTSAAAPLTTDWYVGYALQC